jgi:hypothetical protein
MSYIGDHDRRTNIGWNFLLPILVTGGIALLCYKAGLDLEYIVLWGLLPIPYLFLLGRLMDRNGILCKRPEEPNLDDHRKEGKKYSKIWTVVGLFVWTNIVPIIAMNLDLLLFCLGMVVILAIFMFIFFIAGID